MVLEFSYHPAFTRLMERLKMDHGEALFDLDGIGKQLDLNRFASEFYGDNGATADVSVDSNANVNGRDVINFNFEAPKALLKLNSYYLIWKRIRERYDTDFADAVIEQQLTGWIYINDVWDVGRPYCFNFSTYDIALEGLQMGEKFKPVRPKSLYSFVRQVEQFTAYAANSTLGATGLADLFIVMAHYVDELMDEDAEPHFQFRDTVEAWCYVKEVIASLIYTLNWQFRGNQSPFSNVSVYDRKFLEELVPEYVFPDGTTPHVSTVERIQDMFLDVMNQELARAQLTFPVVTACLAVDDDGVIQDQEFLEKVTKFNEEFGFINFYCGKSSTLSSCCRLRSDMSHEYFNQFGAGSTKIGSLGVVTINLPRLAEEARRYEKHGLRFTTLLDRAVEHAAVINNAKRMEIAKRIERGNLPLYTLGHMDLKRQYSTVGITGLAEACATMGRPITTEDGQALALEIIHRINENNELFDKVFGYPHNCEQVPAENSSIKLARKDRLIGYNVHDLPFYSNQFIPLTAKADILDRIEIQGKLDKHFSGGAICHLNMAEKVTASQQAQLVRECAREGVIYFALNYALSWCENAHMSVATGETCPVCGGEITDTYTRVVGFLTNTKNWHEARREHDWPKRQFYSKVG